MLDPLQEVGLCKDRYVSSTIYISDEVKHLVLNSKNVKVPGSDDLTKQNLKLETLIETLF